MPDLNDLSRPVTTDTEPNVLDTLRAHIIRVATWSGWSATGNKVAGIMSAVTTVVSGGCSLRLYRRNDANTSDEEIVSLPGVSIGGSANAVAWSGVSDKPSTVAGYGITDMSSQTVRHAATSGSANTVPWSGVSGKPTTLAGYGITDGGVTTTQVLNATAGATAGAVGTYAIMVPVSTGINVPMGGTAPGSSLFLAGVDPSGTIVAYGGTWRNMGTATPWLAAPGDSRSVRNLWLRIA